MVWKCRVKGEDEKVLIPKKEVSSVLFDEYRTLKEIVIDVKRVIDKDSGGD